MCALTGLDTDESEQHRVDDQPPPSTLHRLTESGEAGARSLPFTREYSVSGGALCSGGLFALNGVTTLF